VSRWEGATARGGRQKARAMRRLRPSRQRVASPSIARLSQRPMVVVPIRVLMEYQTFPVFEQLFAAEQLEEWSADKQTVFISHTWLGNDHPDPAGEKFGLLLDVLTRVQAGKLQAPLHWTIALAGMTRGLRTDLRGLANGYVWIDYCCVPQRFTHTSARERDLAIASIPYYIACCSYFFVLAGAWIHVHRETVGDLRAWMGRGWCRMELLSNALAPHPKPLVLIESTTAVTSWLPCGIMGRGWLMCPVGCGSFTDERDRTALGGVIRELIRSREHQAEREGDLHFLRLLRTCSHRLLEGTGCEVEQPKSLSDFLSHLRFDGPRDQERSGNSPLRMAVLSTRLDLTEQLLVAGADVEAPLLHADPRFEGHIKGQTVLHLASAYTDSPDMLKLLLAHGADASRADRGGGVTALHYACAAGHVGNIDVLMVADPSLGSRSCTVGHTPASYALAYGRAEAYTHLATRWPHTAPGSWDGYSAASVALCVIGDIQTLRTAIELGGDVNLSKTPRTSTKLIGLFAVADMAARLACIHLCSSAVRGVLEHMAFSSRCSALHRAAFMGHIMAVEILLVAGANAGSTLHHLRMTPLHLAAMRGHKSVVCRLLGAGASAGTKDSRDSTPIDYAKRYGHREVVEVLEKARKSECHSKARGHRAATRSAKIGAALSSPADDASPTRPTQRKHNKCILWCG